MITVRLRNVKRVWLIAFVVGLIGNAWLVSQASRTLADEANSSRKTSLADFTRLPNRLKVAKTALKKSNVPEANTTTSVSFENMNINSSQPEFLFQNSNEKKDDDYANSFSICLLIKDDNDILPEWVAYHYHVLKLRHLIVAVDPDSQTSPSSILNEWRSLGLKVEEWTDADFLPNFFLKGDFEQVPRMVKYSDNATKWQSAPNESAEQLQANFVRINNHRYRQATFLSACTNALHNQNRTWMAHIDTDEYMVINPTLRKESIAGNVTVPQQVGGKSTIFNFLQELVKLNSKVVNWPCISLPRLFFGSVQDAVPEGGVKVPVGFTSERFESLRWKYHAAYDDRNLNKLPKVILDVSGMPPMSVEGDSETNGKVFSIHRPSIKFCRKGTQMNFWVGRKYPLTVNHYIGSFERYQSRDDPRRSVAVCKSCYVISRGVVWNMAHIFAILLILPVHPYADLQFQSASQGWKR
jgi:hypothetical protein